MKSFREFLTERNEEVRPSSASEVVKQLQQWIKANNINAIARSVKMTPLISLKGKIPKEILDAAKKRIGSSNRPQKWQTSANREEILLTAKDWNWVLENN